VTLTRSTLLASSTASVLATSIPLLLAIVVEEAVVEPAEVVVTFLPRLPMESAIVLLVLLTNTPRAPLAAAYAPATPILSLGNPSALLPAA
jgi:hypothetical protein